MARGRDKAEWERTALLAWVTATAAGAKNLSMDAFNPYRDEDRKKNTQVLSMNDLKAVLFGGKRKRKAE